MSSRRVYILKCDARGCGAEYAGRDKAGETRMFASQDGWSHRVVQRAVTTGPSLAVDCCPEHSAEELEAAYLASLEVKP